MVACVYTSPNKNNLTGGTANFVLTACNESVCAMLACVGLDNNAAQPCSWLFYFSLPAWVAETSPVHLHLFGVTPKKGTLYIRYLQQALRMIGNMAKPSTLCALVINETTQRKQIDRFAGFLHFQQHPDLCGHGTVAATPQHDVHSDQMTQCDRRGLPVLSPGCVSNKSCIAAFACDFRLLEPQPSVLRSGCKCMWTCF